MLKSPLVHPLCAIAARRGLQIRRAASLSDNASGLGMFHPAKEDLLRLPGKQPIKLR
jgi:hypothetical protein